MEPLATNYEQIFKDLMELGFNKNFISKALQLTNDKEKAAELILKFQEEEEEDNVKRALLSSKIEAQNQLNPIQPNLNVLLPNIQKDQNILNEQNKKDELEEDSWYSPKNDFKMVILVRTDLKMGVGKIAAQVGHAVLGAYKNVKETKNQKNLEDLEDWEEYGQAKVVLKVQSKKEMLELESQAKALGLNTCVICDAGRTQIDPGTMTVCAIGPAEKSVIDSITKNLKLL